MENHKLYYLSIFTLTISFLVIGYFAFLLFQPFKEPIIYTNPFEVVNENKEVKRGGELFFKVDFEKRAEVPVTTYSNYECRDGNLVTLVTTDSIVQKSFVPIGRQEVTDSRFVPEKTSLGECKLVMSVVYHINPLKDVTRIRETEWFTVVE